MSLRSYLVVFALMFTAPAFAESDIVLETCQLSSLDLTADTQIFCEGDLLVEPGSVIQANGYILDLRATGSLNLADLTVENAYMVWLDAGLNFNGSPRIQADFTIEFEAGSSYDFAPNFQAPIIQGWIAGEELILTPTEHTIALH